LRIKPTNIMLNSVRSISRIAIHLYDRAFIAPPARRKVTYYVPFMPNLGVPTEFEDARLTPTWGLGESRHIPKAERTHHIAGFGVRAALTAGMLAATGLSDPILAMYIKILLLDLSMTKPLDITTFDHLMLGWLASASFEAITCKHLSKNTTISDERPSVKMDDFSYWRGSR
jgi:hypothetical protein